MSNSYLKIHNNKSEITFFSLPNYNHPICINPGSLSISIKPVWNLGILFDWSYFDAQVKTVVQFYFSWKIMYTNAVKIKVLLQNGLADCPEDIEMSDAFLATLAWEKRQVWYL